jgi:hypothetical protein
LGGRSAWRNLPAWGQSVFVTSLRARGSPPGERAPSPPMGCL